MSKETEQNPVEQEENLSPDSEPSSQGQEQAGSSDQEQAGIFDKFLHLLLELFGQLDENTKSKVAEGLMNSLGSNLMDLFDEVKQEMDKDDMNDLEMEQQMEEMRQHFQTSSNSSKSDGSREDVSSRIKQSFIDTFGSKVPDTTQLEDKISKLIESVELMTEQYKELQKSTEASQDTEKSQDTTLSASASNKEVGKEEGMKFSGQGLKQNQSSQPDKQEQQQNTTTTRRSGMSLSSGDCSIPKGSAPTLPAGPAAQEQGNSGR